MEASPTNQNEFIDHFLNLGEPENITITLVGLDEDGHWGPHFKTSVVVPAHQGYISAKMKTALAERKPWSLVSRGGDEFYEFCSPHNLGIIIRSSFRLRSDTTIQVDWTDVGVVVANDGNSYDLSSDPNYSVAYTFTVME